MVKCWIGAGETHDVLFFNPIFLSCVVPLSSVGVPADRDGTRLHDTPVDASEPR
jgi:hypothetical protein